MEMLDKAIKLALAISLALEVHEDQVDKSGQPYILHPLRVMNKMDTIEEKIVAVLHDVIEDAKVPKKITKKLDKEFSINTALYVKTLSRCKDESYSSYIRRVKCYPLTIKVKLADLEDNLDLKRLKKFSDISSDSLRMYLEAWKELKDEQSKNAENKERNR